MALVPATLTVNFSAAYTLGCHRVCYSTNALGPFDNCVEETFLVAGPASIDIPILVDPESCEPVTYYGYVQACCEEYGSVNGRSTWSETYTPTPTCEPIRFTSTVDGSSIVNVGNICNSGTEILSKAVGTEFVLCYPGGISGLDFIAAQPAWNAALYNYIADTLTCCNDCVTVEVTGVGNYQYVDCSGVLTNANIPSGTVTICAKPDSWSSNFGSTVTFNQTASTCTLL